MKKLYLLVFFVLMFASLSYAYPSEVNATYYCVDETNTCAPNITYTTNVTINDEGIFYFRYYSDDNAGNNETVNSLGPILIDYTAPTTTHNITGVVYNTNYNPYVTVELIEFDNVSGTNTTQYCISNTTCIPNITYTGNLTLHESGTHVVYYNSTDNAGNVQTTQNTTLTINSIFKDYTTSETLEFPDIGDTIQLNVTLDSNVANNVFVNYCELFVDDGVYRSESNISVNSLITSDIVLDYNFTVTTNTGLGNENVSWSVVCYDNETRAFTSDEKEFEVKFTTPPTVEFNQTLTNFNVTNNLSVLSKDLYDVEFSVDIESVLIDAIYADIYCPANGYIYNLELLNVNQTNYTLTDSVDLSLYETGLCIINVTATTLSSGGTPIPTTITSEFYIGSTIYVDSLNNYDNSQIEDFNIIVENKDGYPPYNKIINNVNSTYILENVSNGNYILQFTSNNYFNKTYNIEIIDTTNIIYQTGEAYLNVRFRNIQTLADLYNVSFVIYDLEGNGLFKNTYEDSTLYQTLSTSANYVVVKVWDDFNVDEPYFISNITNQYRNAVNTYTAFVRYRFYYSDGSSALTSVLSTSSSTWQNGFIENPNPNRAVDKIELEMRTNSGSSGRFAQTRNHIFNLVRGYYSGDNITTNLFINNGTYEISWDAPGFLPNTREFSIEYLQNKTLTLDTSFVGTFNLINERTLEPFDMTKPDRVEFQLFCSDKTTVSQVVPSTSSSFTLNITCDYAYFRFQVVYPDTSYYRSFIIDPDDLFNLDIYLIDSLEDRAVYNTMLTDDLLSRYENIRVFVYKSIGDERVQITASYIDIENKVGVFLLENNLYTVEIHSDNLPVLVLGDYSADSAGAKNIQLYDIGTFDPTIDSIEQVTYVVDTHTNELNETFAVFRYNDNQNKTETVTFNVYEGRGSTVPVRTITTVMQNGLVNVNITGIYDSNTTLYAEVLASRPTAQFDNNINYKAIIREDNTIRLEILEFFSTQAVSWFFMILLGMIAIMATIQTANWVSIALIALAFMFAAFAWLPVAMSVLAFSAIISIVSILKEGEKLS